MAASPDGNLASGCGSGDVKAWNELKKKRKSDHPEKPQGSPPADSGATEERQLSAALARACAEFAAQKLVLNEQIADER